MLTQPFLPYQRLITINLVATLCASCHIAIAPPPLSPPRPAPTRYTSPHSNPFHPAHHTTPYTSLPDPNYTPSHPTSPDLQARHCGTLHELFGR